MDLTLVPLKPEHFSFLKKWLNEPYLTNTFGEKHIWTDRQITDKYSHEMDAYILLVEEKPIGYLQYYNAYDYPRDGYNLREALQGTDLESISLAAIDLFIGESDHLSQGYGTKALQSALERLILRAFDACLVDPDKSNLRAIKAYQKAGFVPLKTCGNSLLLVIRKISP